METSKNILFDETTKEENKELICAICKNFLSIPPVLYNSEFGNVCGRWQCNALAHRKGENFAQNAYESVAKFLVFPCMFRENGCRTNLKWNEVAQHEETCNYRNFPCPLSMDEFGELDRCNWSGDTSGILAHLEENHANRFFLNSLQVGFHMDTMNQAADVFFSKILQDLVVVLILVNDEKTELLCKVWAGFSIFKNLKYQIRIMDKNRKDSTCLKKQQAELFVPHIFKQKFDNSWLGINFEYMKNFLETPDCIIFEFEYNNVKLSVTNECKIELNNSQDNYFHTELREAKCDNCSNELFPPVFMCTFAHNICAACKRNEVCPKCSSKLAKSRNIAYEKLKFLLDQPCKNYNQGCFYTAGYPYIKEHEEMCSFNPRKCILGCSSEVGNLLNHLKLEHPLSVSALDTLYNLNRLKLHVFLFDNQIFLFTKRLSTDEGFSFNIQCLGAKEVRYRYELHLVNDKFIESEIVLSHTCHPELFDFNKHSNDVLKGLTNVLLIPNTVLEQIFPDLRNMKFKINISKLVPNEAK